MIFCASVFITASDCNCFSQNAKKKQIPPATPALGMTSERLLSLVEEGLEAGVAGAAYRQARAVGENRKAAILAVRLDAPDALQVHEVRAVDAHVAVRVEACLQAGDGLLLEVLLSPTGQRHVVVLGLRVVKLGDRNQRNLRAVLYDQAFLKLLRRPRRGREFVGVRHFPTQTAFRSFQSRIKALASDGLQ